MKKEKFKIIPIKLELSEINKEFAEWKEWLEKIISEICGIPEEYFKDKK